MKTLRHVMLGVSLLAVGLGGCAERPGKKKDDDKADSKDKSKGKDKDKKDDKAKSKSDKKE